MELEEALALLANGSMKWHWYQFFLLSVFYIPFAFTIMAPAYYTGIPESVTCVEAGGYTLDDRENGTNITVSSDQCEVYIEGERKFCTSWLFGEEPFGKTIVSEFSLVCEDSRLPAFSMSAFAVGISVGVLFINLLADSIGRKPIILPALAANSILFFLLYLLPGFWSYTIIRFCQGIIGIGFGYCPYILEMEILPIHLRTFFGIGLNAVWVIGYCASGIIFQFTRDWRTHALVCSLLHFAFIPHLWIMIESPQFYVGKERFEEAEDIIKKAAKFNGMTLPEDFHIEAENHPLREEENKRTYTPIDLVKTPRMRLNMVIASMAWLAHNMTYYVLSLGSTGWSKDVHLAYQLGGLIEVPAYIAAVFIGQIFGRKYPLVIGQVLLAVILLGQGQAQVMIPEANILLILLGVINKFISGISFAIAILWSLEVFPTVVRSMASGGTALVGEIGSITAPYILISALWYQPLPYFISAVLMAVSGIFLIFASDTFERPLPIYIEDTEVLHLQKRQRKNKNDGGEVLTKTNEHPGKTPKQVSFIKESTSEIHFH